MFGRANTRAEGGDVFVQRPGGPCYGCLVGNRSFDPSSQEVASREAGVRSGAIAAYTSPEDAAAIVQVGLSCDIMPIVNLMVKLALESQFLSRSLLGWSTAFIPLWNGYLRSEYTQIVVSDSPLNGVYADRYYYKWRQQC